MDRWSQLSLKDKSDLMSLYIQNGISSLEEIKKHYNSYQDGGPVSKKTPNFVQRFNEGNKRDIPFQGGHATHLLSYAERDGKYYVYPEVQPTDYNNSNSPLQYYGRNWRVAFDRAYDNNDYLEFDTEEAARNYSENYKKVPSTGAVLSGPSRGNYNILDYMRGYATGGHLYQDGGDDDNKTFVSSQASETGWMPEVKVEAEHPLWSLPWYKDKKGNPNINRHKDELWNNWRRHNEAGKDYLKRVAGGLSVVALPIGGAAGFILGVPDLATDFVEMIDKPSVSNATELTLDAPTRYGTELDNALISVLKSNKYTKPLAKILQYNDVLQYIGAANDASSAVTGKSIIEHASK